MYNKKLTRQFFARVTLLVAKELLGKLLVRKIGQQKLVGRIVEVEAYHGPQDRASHASRGRTARNALMFGQAGWAYVYLIYGMYWCFNIVTGAKDFPAAVLIRAVEPLAGMKQMSKNRKAHLASLTNGPGKLCQTLKIDKKLNGLDLTQSHQLWLEDDGFKLTQKRIEAAERVGVDYAGPWRNKKWRFYIKNNPFVSRP